MASFEALILADCDRQLAATQADADWVKANTAWQNVNSTESKLTAYGADSVLPADYPNYLRAKLSDVTLSGASVLSNSDVSVAVNDIVGMEFIPLAMLY